jgi:hypothetical protein
LILVLVIVLLAVIAFVGRNAYESFYVAQQIPVQPVPQQPLQPQQPSRNGDPYIEFPDLNAAGNDVMCGQKPWVCKGRVFDVKSDLNVNKRLYFKDPTGSDASIAANNTDPYYLEKVVRGPNDSSLRLTINDDPDESFEIWGGGGGGGTGSRQHRLRADGGAGHRGGLLVGDGDGRATQEVLGYNFGVASYNPVSKGYTRFPDKDGRNRVSGDLVLAESGTKVCIRDTCITEGDLANLLALPKQVQAQSAAMAAQGQQVQAANDALAAKLAAAQLQVAAAAQAKAAVPVVAAVAPVVVKQDCKVSDWSACSKPCGSGTQVRTIAAQPQNGGIACPPLSQACNTQACVDEIYAFTSHTFSNCGATGPNGPTLEACKNYYKVQGPWVSNPNFLSMVNPGYQLWTVPATGTYLVTVAGAAGGPNGGGGVIQSRAFDLSKGERLTIVVGQMGSGANNGNTSSGGGGGSFVWSSSPLLYSGGGGGALNNQRASDSTADATMQPSGRASSDGTGAGGTPGKGGSGSTGGWGAGGAGTGTDGTAGSRSGTPSSPGQWGYSGPGVRLDAGFLGGSSSTNTAMGGFGGGGGTHGGTGGGGGGGGYSGGGGSGQDKVGATGGGGGSFGGGTYLGLNKTEHGWVRIERIPKYKQMISDLSIDGNWWSLAFGDILITNTKGGNNGNCYIRHLNEKHTVKYEGNNKWTILKWPSEMRYIYDIVNDTFFQGRLVSDFTLNRGSYDLAFVLV